MIVCSQQTIYIIWPVLYLTFILVLIGYLQHKIHVDARKKGKSCEYYLVGNSENKRVCQSFFCRTFAISNCVVYAALKGKGESDIYTKQDGRIGRPAPNKIEDDRVKHFHNHINSFPIVEPHYYRRYSTMQYLSPELNGAQMYSCTHFIYLFMMCIFTQSTPSVRSTVLPGAPALHT